MLLGQCIKNETDAIVPAALRLLAVCREYTAVLEDIAELRSSLRHGGAEAISLFIWRNVRAFRIHGFENYASRARGKAEVLVPALRVVREQMLIGQDE